MDHLRNFALLCVAVILLAGPCFAQTVTLQLNNVGPGNQIGGDYTYPYNFSINGSPSYTPLLCDDYSRQISFGESWTANVYPLTSPLTAFGQSSQWPGFTPAEVYEAAAIIYTEILNNTVPGANGNPALASEYGNLAVWALFDGGSQNSGYNLSIEIPIINNALYSVSQYGSSFYSQFSVYTPTNLTPSGPQEFIGYSPGWGSVQFLGGGTSSLFQGLGQAAVNVSGGPGTACVWTQSASSSMVAQDNRTTPPADDQGNIWVVWSPGAGTCAAPGGNFPVYSYMTLESVTANRCFFEVDTSGTPGCVEVASVAPNTPGANLLPVGDTSGGIPLSVINALNGQHFIAAGTHIRPEDALFATQRVLTPCNQYTRRQYFNDVSYDLFGLGYQTGNPNVGAQILGNSAYGAGVDNVLNFSIIGNDPITSGAVPAYSISTIGAQPILVAVAPTSDGAVQQMTDIMGYTLAQFYAGNVGRTTDLYGVTYPEAINFLVPSPLAGAWNVFEYSVPQTTQFHTGQETGNCNAGSVLQNPMDLPTIPGVFGDAVNRIRVVGTGNMTASLLAACPGGPRLGYFFWNAATVQGLNNVKYLKVNGVDPLYDQTQSTYQYTGILPGSGAPGDPGLSGVNFAMVNAADYPIWSPLRLIGPPGNAGVAAIVAALNSLASSQQDYVPFNKMNIWHSHFQIVGQPANAANGQGTNYFCQYVPQGGNPVPEAGGDAGGSTMLGINDTNFCSDFSIQTGKLNLTQ